MKLLRQLMRTSGGWELVLLRTAVAADLFLDGSRTAKLHWLIGTPRLTKLMPTLPAGVATSIGYLQLAVALLIAAGLFTRVACLLQLALPLLMTLVAWDRIRSLDAALMLDAVVHHAAIALMSVLLVVKGAGSVSGDALLVPTHSRRF